MDKRRTVSAKRYLFPALLFAALAVVPLFGDAFHTRLASRIMIYGLAAVSLDLILGFGGMVSFGHAAFLGIGAYTAAIFGVHGVSSAWVVWPTAVAAAAVAAGVIGALSLRTTGAYFIMITLAFAQMLYYFFSSLEEYGGADGLAMWNRNRLTGLLDLSGNTPFYYTVLFCLASGLILCGILVRSRFGAAIRGIKENERRMRSLGYPVFRYKLLCFVIAGAMAGLAGALLANQAKYVSPAILHWTRSGEILVMVILGGMGTLVGPVMGAAGLLLAEEILSSVTEHWMVFLGPILILVVLFARGGIFSLLNRTSDKRSGP